MGWLDNFDERQRKEIEFSKIYARDFHHGTDGHNGKIIISMMADLLDSPSSHKPFNALGLAIVFHDYYEKLAPSFGYETRAETRKFDPESPNGKLMIAVCSNILAEMREK